MFSLPNEAKLDVLKCLDFNQLFSVKQTNFYFRNLINKYEGELARMKFNTLSLADENDCFVYTGKIIDLESGLFDFTLNDQLKEKWQAAVDKSIPLFLDIFENSKSFVCIRKRNFGLMCYSSYLLELPKFPKNIEEMIIVRCWLEHLFNCAFEYADFSRNIFNPQMINILFDNDKTIPLQFNIQTSAILFVDKKLIENILKFSLNHLLVSELLSINLIDDDTTEQHTNLLFNILINEGNKFTKIFLRGDKLSKFYHLITEYIATTRDFSKMVHVIDLYSIYTNFKLSERAEKVEIKQETRVKYTKYQIANIYNPKVKFSFYSEERYGSIYIKIKK
uniref:F-box domain-containing protein n=1 Tax=Meloidogyne enterolobii TaxID=390850 RepID=A0A6V7WQB5_MELEN|nr:unnamed protein product [Meloidogyne enterolobii]